MSLIGDIFFCFNFRAAVDAVRKLDDGLKKKRAYREVFHQDAVGLRYKYVLNETQ